jgi:hypothetical protein
MGLRDLLSTWLGEHITVTVAPEAFTFAARDESFREATVLRVSDGKLAALGSEVHLPNAMGRLVSLFDGERPTEAAWANEPYFVLYCRYYLALMNERFLWSLLGVGPQVDVVGAERLRHFFRGQETAVLDRLLRRAGAGTVRFLPGASN